MPIGFANMERACFPSSDGVKLASLERSGGIAPLCDGRVSVSVALLARSTPSSPAARQRIRPAPNASDYPPRGGRAARVTLLQAMSPPMWKRERRRREREGQRAADQPARVVPSGIESREAE